MEYSIADLLHQTMPSRCGMVGNMVIAVPIEYHEVMKSTRAVLINKR